MSTNEKTKLKFAVGSKNPTKIEAARRVIELYFPTSLHDWDLVFGDVPSGVSDQPMSATESIKGASTRATNARDQFSADYGIGMEGGLENINDLWFECGWIAVVDKSGKRGLGSSGRFQLGEYVTQRLQKGEELCTVVDDVTNQRDLRSSLGAMGVITKGQLPRAECYAHGVFFAFAPFVTDYPQFFN